MRYIEHTRTRAHAQGKQAVGALTYEQPAANRITIFSTRAQNRDRQGI